MLSEFVTEDLTEYRYLLSLVKAAVSTVSPKAPPANLDWQKLFEISLENTFVCAAFYAVSALPKDSIPRSVYEKFFVAFQRYVALDTVKAKALTGLLAFCEAHQIENIPLKGSYLRDFYPQPDMRYMIDIDLLIHETDAGKIQDYLTGNGYALRCGGAKHDEYCCQSSGVIIEVHKRLIAQGKTNYNYFQDVWKRKIPREGYRYSFQMNQTDFYVFMAEHCVHHFFHGGIPARMVLDFYIFNHNVTVLDEKTAIKNALAQTGLTAFEKKLSSLAADWFSADGKGLQNDPFSLYIMGNGKMGSLKNIVVTNAAVLSHDGVKSSKRRYLFGQLFPPANVLKMNFAVLKRIPLLTPFMIFPWWYRRLRNALSADGKKFKTMQYIKTLDSEQETVESIRNMIRELKIDDYM